MKKFIAFCFCIVLGFTAALPSGTTSVYAETFEKTDEQIISQTTEYLEDGSYIIITISEKTYQTARGTAYYKNGSKSYTLYNKDNDELCRFTVSGSFYVNPGVSSSCTKASHSVTITDTAWENDSASSYCSGNQAIGDATFIRKLLGIKVDTKSCHVVLTCDTNGNLS